MKWSVGCVATLTRKLLYLEELVIHITGNMSSHRPVLSHTTLHTQHGFQACVVLIPCLQDKLRWLIVTDEAAGSSQYQWLHHLCVVVFALK